MLKIKVKNIPAIARERICDKAHTCAECPFHMEERYVIDEDTNTGCMVDFRYNPEGRVVELSEQDFPTNREWMESLPDEDLARVIVCGPFPSCTGVYGMTVPMIKEWFSQPCTYLIEKYSQYPVN